MALGLLPSLSPAERAAWNPDREVSLHRSMFLGASPARTARSFTLDSGISLHAPVDPALADILSPEARAFVATLHRQFNARRLQLLADREARQQAIDGGASLGFLPETTEVRESDRRS